MGVYRSSSGDWAATQGTYDFWQSPHVKAEPIRQAHQKSGCRIEQLQLESADRIHRALGTYTIVAWRLL